MNRQVFFRRPDPPGERKDHRDVRCRLRYRAVMRIVPAAPDHITAWADLRQALWPHRDPDFHLQEIAGFGRAGPPTLALVAFDAAGSAIGLIEAALRHDHVNGCDTSPVSFVEGLFVVAAHRRRGVAARLVEAVVPWAVAHGCTELASDAGIENRASHAFHAAAGFAETERVVFFRRRLAPR